MSTKVSEVIVYTDGGCRNNQSSDKSKVIGGWGAILMQGEREKCIKGGKRGYTTNNEMELTAIYKALVAMKRKDITIKIYSDSNLCVQIFNQWVEGWKARGWRKADKKPIANLELIQAIDALRETFIKVEFLKVKGHANDVNNNRVDALVNEAMDEIERG